MICYFEFIIGAEKYYAFFSVYLSGKMIVRYTAALFCSLIGPRAERSSVIGGKAAWAPLLQRLVPGVFARVVRRARVR